jgi:hypothetical protein
MTHMMIIYNTLNNIKNGREQIGNDLWNLVTDRPIFNSMNNSNYSITADQLTAHQDFVDTKTNINIAI